jgi:hypothetical protein
VEGGADSYMDKNFNDFRSFLNETQTPEITRMAMDTIGKYMKKVANERNKIGYEELLVSITAALVHINIVSTLKIVEAYHEWKESQ